MIIRLYYYNKDIKKIIDSFFSNFKIESNQRKKLFLFLILFYKLFHFIFILYESSHKILYSQINFFNHIVHNLKILK